MYKILISLKNLHSTLNQEFKNKFYLLFMVVNAFLEIISLGSIIPFISSILDPNFFDTNIVGKRLSIFSHYDNQSLILIILVFFSTIIIISNI